MKFGGAVSALRQTKKNSVCLAQKVNDRNVHGCFYDYLPVTSSSAVLVACPAPLVALTENLPLCAAVTAGIIRTARPSLNEI